MGSWSGRVNVLGRGGSGGQASTWGEGRPGREPLPESKSCRTSVPESRPPELGESHLCCSIVPSAVFCYGSLNRLRRGHKCDHNVSTFPRHTLTVFHLLSSEAQCFHSWAHQAEVRARASLLGTSSDTKSNTHLSVKGGAYSVTSIEM